MLFDIEPPSDPRPAMTEGVLDILARAEGRSWTAVRDALSARFARYPADDRETLRKRLFGDADKAQAAFWELLLHELYAAARFRVEVHPPLDRSEHRPDFRVSDDESAFLLEARVVTATSAERRARKRRLQTLIDAINRVQPHIDNFYVKIEIVSEGHRQPPVGPVLDALVPWLAQLDPEEVAERQRNAGLRALPSCEIPTGDGCFASDRSRSIHASAASSRAR